MFLDATLYYLPLKVLLEFEVWGQSNYRLRQKILPLHKGLTESGLRRWGVGELTEIKGGKERPCAQCMKEDVRYV